MSNLDVAMQFRAYLYVVNNGLPVKGVKPNHLHDIVETEPPKSISGRQDNLISLPDFDMPLIIMKVRSSN